ncbi:hypothetical protein R1flu_001075 [Riccia fluitans]|uniref:Uncharacterized protein n=1 Tax=Riccia fluitans TaxID=41844 RepID=A0ABD1Y2N9_9MARC
MHGVLWLDSATHITFLPNLAFTFPCDHLWFEQFSFWSGKDVGRIQVISGEANLPKRSQSKKGGGGGPANKGSRE